MSCQRFRFPIGGRYSRVSRQTINGRNLDQSFELRTSSSLPSTSSDNKSSLLPEKLSATIFFSDNTGTAEVDTMRCPKSAVLAATAASVVESVSGSIVKYSID